MSDKKAVKTKSGVRRYHSKKPGVRLALPEKFLHHVNDKETKEYKIDDLAKLLKGKFSIPFPQNNPYFETADPVLIAIVEGDKQFAIGNIIRVTTEEERESLKLEEAQTAYLKVQKANLSAGIFKLEDLTLNGLQSIAEAGGVATVTGEDKPLPKNELLKDVQRALASV